MKFICSDQCEQCKHCTVETIDKSNVFINCNLNNKKYRYGQRIECSDVNMKEGK